MLCPAIRANAASILVLRRRFHHRKLLCQLLRKVDPERCGGIEIDHSGIFGDLFDRIIGNRLPLQDPCGHPARLTAQHRIIDANRRQTAVSDHRIGPDIDRQPRLGGNLQIDRHGRGDGVVVGGKEGVDLSDQRLGGLLQLPDAGDGRLLIGDPVGVAVGAGPG